MPYINVNVDVDLDVFSDSELIDEVKSRKLNHAEAILGETSLQLITSIWQKRREDKDYQKELNDLIYHSIGKII